MNDNSTENNETVNPTPNPTQSECVILPFPKTIKIGLKEQTMEYSTKTVEISYENLEGALIPFFYALGVLDDNEEVITFDFPVALNEKGLVEIDMEIMTRG